MVVSISMGGCAERIAGLTACQSGVFCRLVKGFFRNRRGVSKKIQQITVRGGNFQKSPRQGVALNLRKMDQGMLCLNPVKTSVPGMTRSGLSVSDIPSQQVIAETRGGKSWQAVRAPKGATVLTMSLAAQSGERASDRFAGKLRWRRAQMALPFVKC